MCCRKIVFLILLLPIANSIYAQDSKGKFGVGLQFGDALTWWKSNRGDGLGWDRSANIHVPGGSFSVFYELPKWQWQLGVARNWWWELELELFEDRPRQRRRIDLGDGFVPITDFEFKGLYYLISESRFTLGIGAGIGLFQLSTEDPIANSFGTMWLWSTEMVSQHRISKNWTWHFSIVYENKKIEPKNEGVGSDGHQIFSYGMNFGLNYLLQ